MKNEKATPAQWVPRARMSQILGISIRAIDLIREKLEYEHEKKVGREIRLHAPQWLRAWAALQKAKSEANDAMEKANLRLKTARGRLLELRLAEEDGSMIRVSEAVKDMRRYASTIFKGMETIQRISPEAFDEMSPIVEELDNYINDKYGRLVHQQKVKS